MQPLTTNTENIPRIFSVDDDVVFLRSLELEFLEHHGYNIQTFTTGEQCVENLFLQPDVIILDYILSETDSTMWDGSQTLDRIKAFNPDLPVVMLSCQDKIEVAIKCMQHNAFDYVVKSETAFIRLQRIISNIFRYQKIERELKAYTKKAERTLS